MYIIKKKLISYKDEGGCGLAVEKGCSPTTNFEVPFPGSSSPYGAVFLSKTLNP